MGSPRNPSHEKVFCNVLYSGQIIEATVYVVRGAHRSLLSYKTASDLKLSTILQLVTEHSSVDAKKEFPKLLGKVCWLKNFPFQLNNSQDVQPAARQHCSIPFQSRKPGEAGHHKVTRPTPWVSPIIIVAKFHGPNTVKVCIDIREANMVIERERYIVPTVEDIISILNGVRTERGLPSARTC